MKIRRSIKKSNLMALSAAIILSLTTFSNVSAEDKSFDKHMEGEAIGYTVDGGQEEYGNVVMNVSGIGVVGEKKNNNVTGLYVKNGGDVTIQNLKVTVKNDAPATQGDTPGADLAHYYMSGVYAGYYGIIQSDDEYLDNTITINGDVDMDVVGVAVHAGKASYINIFGGGTIKTYTIPTSETYALLAEEGSVSMNVKRDGDDNPIGPGDSKVNIYGNIGIINKNYGNDKNIGSRPSSVELALTTSDSKLEGGLLNEFAENGENPKNSGIDLYVKNKATWINHWIGTKRIAAQRENAESYLYKGSKVRNFFGGDSLENAGVIFQKDSMPITIQKYHGAAIVKYAHDGMGVVTGGEVIINAADAGSQIYVRTAGIGDLAIDSDDPDEKAVVEDTLKALAKKIQYKGGNENLQGKVEIAEGLDTPAISKDLYFDGLGWGTLEKAKVDPQVIPSVPSGKKPDGEYRTKINEGPAIGYDLNNGGQTTINSNLTVDVSGKGIVDEQDSLNVAGISITNQSKLLVTGNLKITVKNSRPATHGSKSGVEDAHYYTNGLYVRGNNEGKSIAVVDGDVDIDAVGVGVQAGYNSSVLIKGGGNIIARPVVTSDTYALLSEEGSIYMNMKLDSEGGMIGAGDKDVNIYGNIGILNKNYGDNANPGKNESNIYLGLATSNSIFTGGILNEFEENGNNPQDSGIDLYLQNGATWINQWIGMMRGEAPRKDASTYLYKGSKVHHFYGGDTFEHAGFIVQNDEHPIDIESYQGHTIVKYGHDGKGHIEGGDIRIEEAGKNSEIYIRTVGLNGLNPTSTKEDDIRLINQTLSALAQKLVYKMDNGKLKGKVEIAEGVMTPSISKDITYYDENHRGVYNPTGTIPSHMKKVQKFEGHSDGQIVVRTIDDDQEETYDNVIMDVSGKGIGNGSVHNKVIGMYILAGGKLHIKGDLTVTLKNSKPGTQGYWPGEHLAHYYSNGIYAGYGGYTEPEGQHGDSKATIDGNVYMDVVGVPFQANKDGYITIKGGGSIKTHALTTDTYALEAEEGTVFMNVGETGNKPGHYDVNIYGNLGLLNKNYGMDINPGNHGTFIALGLTTADSKLVGGILNEFAENGKNPYDSGVDLYLQNGAVWDNQWIGAHRVAAQRPNAETYLYHGSKVRNLIGGKSKVKAGIIYQNENKDITVKNFSGHVKVIYKQNATNAKAFDGGAVRIKTAKEKSQITLRSNIRDFQKPSGENADYDALLNTLAGKLYYEAKDDHLTAYAEIAESLAAPAYAKKISFKTADGQGEVKPGTMLEQDGTSSGQTSEQGGSSSGQTSEQSGTSSGQDPKFETSVMKGIRSTMVSTGMISTGAFWSAQNNDVERRMGDIRLARTETGLWAKYQGGSSEYNDTDSREKAVHVDQTYSAIQVGYDKSVGDWIVGGTFSYGTTKDKYIDNRDTGKLNGTGKETGVNGGVYGTLKQKDGSYLDIIAKVGQIKNNYEVYTKDWDKDKKNDDKVNSEYKVNGTSLSVEYGKRIEREGFYVEPSMELTVNRVAGHSEEVTSEVHKYKMKITQDDMTSVVGRIGVGIGQNHENGHIYGKLSLAHEFNGDIMTTFSAGNKEEVVKLSLRGTWLDVEMGGSYRLSKDSYFYGSFTKNFGAKLNNKWRLDAGIRLAF